MLDLEVLTKSLQIKETLSLQSIVVVFDQALYAKATTEIKWKHSAQFNDIFLRMGVFHTICTFLAVIGKRFQDAGLRDVCVESGVIADGVCGCRFWKVVAVIVPSDFTSLCSKLLTD